MGKRIKTGDALVNVHLAELTSSAGTRFLHGVQFQGGKSRAFVEPRGEKLGAAEAREKGELHARLRDLVGSKPDRWTGGTSAAPAEGGAGHRSVRLRDEVLPVGTRRRRAELTRGEWAKAVAAAVKLTREDLGEGTFQGFAWRSRGRTS